MDGEASCRSRKGRQASLGTRSKVCRPNAYLYVRIDGRACKHGRRRRDGDLRLVLWFSLPYRRRSGEVRRTNSRRWPRVALGQGVGMTIGAAVARPGKQVVTLVGDGGIGISGPDIETMIHYGLPGVIVVLNNRSWGGNSLQGDDIHPNIDWSVGKNNRWDLAFQALGAHGEYVERSADLKPALKRALESGKPAVVNVVADCDGVEYSQAWLRLKSGDMYSRGLDEISREIKSHFNVSPLNALRIRKSAEDNGTQIPLSFIAELTNNDIDDLRRVAADRRYIVR